MRSVLAYVVVVHLLICSHILCHNSCVKCYTHAACCLSCTCYAACQAQRVGTAESQLSSHPCIVATRHVCDARDARDACARAAASLDVRPVEAIIFQDGSDDDRKDDDHISFLFRRPFGKRVKL